MTTSAEATINPHVNPIASRLSLRPPQRRSLEILARLCDILPMEKGADVAHALAIVRSEFPHVESFEREFPSICFALATGVGKTRLMGAFIAYLYRAQSIRNFFVLAPNLTIYNKLITDFDQPSHPKYVFRGLSEFAVERPVVITGDTYEGMAGALFDQPDVCKINIFNISKINSEVRGGRSPRIKRLSEYIGQSYFDYLAQLEDLVLLMDESHRYRASAGVRAINELRPLLGLELTATPYIESSKGAVPFKNVIYDYPLGQAMADGFVKEPAVVTRKDFNPSGMSPEEIERMKLEDGVRLHASIKVELETYAREMEQAIVKPFVLVIARDTTHAAQLAALIESDAFFEGLYRGRVIQVDSSRTGAEEDQMVQRLLAVEQASEPTEIVIHVNMLKEGWDVTNLYTIIPLRAANARVLIEQSIGRGLRLPYGKRTGVSVVDTLNIVAHDKFQEIVDEARRPGSTIQMKQRVLDPSEMQQRLVTVVSQTSFSTALGIAPQMTSSTVVLPSSASPLFESPAEQEVAQAAARVIQRLESEPATVPTSGHLQTSEVQARIVARVREQLRPSQLALPGMTAEIDVAAVVAKTAAMFVQRTIDIPRIVVVPTGEVRSGFRLFELDLASMRYPAPSEELWIQHLRTDLREVRIVGKGGVHEARLEDYVVAALIDFDDVSYDDNAELLYELAGQVVSHFGSYLSEEDVAKVLRVHQRPIAAAVHAQMQKHYWQESGGYDAKVSRGFTELKPSAYTAAAGVPLRDFRKPPPDKSRIASDLFGGFERCLYDVQKFQSDGERQLAVILDRESLKWFKPAKGQFQIYYQWAGEHPEYQPDFAAEVSEAIYMIEVKARNQLTSDEVIAKRNAGFEWCRHATEYNGAKGGKPWRYLLVPHDGVSENMTLGGLTAHHVVEGIG